MSLETRVRAIEHVVGINLGRSDPTQITVLNTGDGKPLFAILVPCSDAYGQVGPAPCIWRKEDETEKAFQERCAKLLKDLCNGTYKAPKS